MFSGAGWRHALAGIIDNRDSLLISGGKTVIIHMVMIKRNEGATV